MAYTIQQINLRKRLRRFVKGRANQDVFKYGNDAKWPGWVIEEAVNAAYDFILENEIRT